MNKVFAIASAVVFASTAMPAFATTLTFEGQANTIYGAPITRSGYEVGNIVGDEQHFHEIDSTQFGLASNGTGVLLNDRDTSIFLRAANGAIFSLTSIDVAAAFNNSPATGLTISGYLSNVLTGTITINALGQFQTVAGSSLGSVDNLVFDGFGGQGGFELDNAVLGDAVASAVPEPATWAMMVGGFLLVGGAMRRRVTFTPAVAA